MDPDLSLADDGLLSLVHELNRVLKSNDVDGTGPVELGDQRRHRGRQARLHHRGLRLPDAGRHGGGLRLRRWDAHVLGVARVFEVYWCTRTELLVGFENE